MHGTYKHKTGKNLKQHKHQYGGRVFNEQDRERFDAIPLDEKEIVMQYVLDKIDVMDLVDEVIAWIDQNPGLRFDRSTMQELLYENNLEIQDVISQRIQERLA